MSAYAVCNLTETRFGPEIADYLRRIDATLAPHRGRFLVHGGRIEVLEGHWQGALIVLEFPDAPSARAWYDSPAYQDILPLRTRNADGNACIVEGVPAGYRAASKLVQLPDPQQLPAAPAAAAA